MKSLGAIHRIACQTKQDIQSASVKRKVAPPRYESTVSKLCVEEAVRL